MRKAMVTRGRLRVVGVVLLILFLGYLAYDYIVNEPVARSERITLESKMSDIVPPPGVERVSRESSNKTQRAYVSEAFTTTLRLDSLRSYYGAELQRLGWTFARSTTYSETGTNLGQVTDSY